ncbi:MAG: CHAT domain-containing protein [Desulfomonilaceae bacterium]
MNGFVLRTLLIVVLTCLLPALGWAQSEKQGITIYNQAKELQNKARSRQDLEKAVEKYQEALRIFEKARFEKGKGVTLNNIGLVYDSWGQYPKALEYYERSLEITRKLRDVKTEGVTLNNIGLVYKSWGQYPKALEYYEKSLAITRKIGDVKGEGVSLTGIGTVYYSWGQYPKALEYYEKDLAITRKLGDVKGEGVTLNNIATVYYIWGQYPKALEYYEKSLEITRKLRHVKTEGVTLSAIGMVYYAWGQYPKALEYYEKSLEITREIGDVKQEGATLSNIGMVYNSWGQYPKALEYHEKSLEIRQKLGDVKGEGVTLKYIGLVYYSLGQYPKALEYYAKSLAIQKKIGVPYDGTEDSIGNVYLTMGDMENAEPILKKANRWVSLGRLALVKSDFNEAKNQFDKQLSRSSQNRDVQGLFAGHTGLGLSYEGLNQYDQAAEHYKHAIEVTEQIRDSLTPAQRTDFYDAEISHIPRITPYKGLARVLQKAGKPEQSLKESEGSKARSFAESLSRRSENISLDVPKDVVERDADINNRLAALSQGLQKAYEKGSKDAIESFEKQVKEVREERDRHINKLRTEYPLFAATKYPQPMGIEHTALKDNEWVLGYDVSDSGLLVYLTRGKQLVKSLFKPIPEKQLEDLVQKCRRAMETGPEESIMEKVKSFDFASGKKLADLVLSDILPDLPKDAPLIIIPDGPFGVVPFEMLVLNDGGKVQTDKTIPYVSGAEFFGDRNPISYYQSITALTLARTLGKQQKPGDRTLAMVDPVFSPDDARLVKAATEKRRAALDKLTGDKFMSFKTELALEIPRLPLTTQLGESLKKADPAKTDLYEGMKAQKSELLRKDLKPYHSVVFGTHGYFGKDLPGIQEPVLILTLPDQPEGQDGFLRMTEVMGLKMNCDVAALTACQTGLGRHISGEGTMGMGRAFQYAGAKSVLMSLWSVAEKSSVEMVESFFKHLKQGKNRLEALRLARDEIRKAGYDHPFFWAPFILVGEVD